MNRTTIYEGVLTGTVRDWITEVAFSQVADHACRCDECVALDEVDLPMLALCKRYLNKELTSDEFRLEQVRTSCQLTERQLVLHRHFDRGSVSFPQALEGLMFSVSDDIDELTGRMTLEHTPFTNREFRIALHGLVLGYENRMRTIHEWNKSAT